jgi:hypothetical protein
MSLSNPLRSILAAALIISTALAPSASLGRVWTAADGRTMEAEFISASATGVTVKRPGDVRPIVITYDKLSEADRAWVEEQKANANPAGGRDAGDTGGRITVKCRQLMLNGQPWQARGVCYHPVPIGKKAGSGDLCLDDRSDLFERDLPLIRGLNANLLRLYSWDPTGSHKQFLKELKSGSGKGPKGAPLRVLVNKYIKPETNWADQGEISALIDTFTAIAKDVAKEELVLGIAIGNEANVNGAGDTDGFWEAHERIAAAIKKEAPQTLIMIPITDKLAQVEKADKMLKSVDVWAMQIYRGSTFSRLFSDYERLSERPLLITEFGIDAYDARINAEGKDDAAFVAEAFQDLWKELHSAKKTCAGGCWFSFTDEWWKASGSADTQETTGKPNGYPDKVGNEEWYGIYRIAPGEPNKLTPRAIATTMQKLWR